MDILCKLFHITCTWIRADNLLEKSFLSDPHWDQAWHHPTATERNANKLHSVEKLVSNTHELSWNRNRNTHGGQGFLQALCRLSPGELCRGAFREGCCHPRNQQPERSVRRWPTRRAEHGEKLRFKSNRATPEPGSSYASPLGKQWIFQSRGFLIWKWRWHFPCRLLRIWQ